MKAIIPLVRLGLLLAACSGAAAGEAAEPLRAYVRNSSFTIVLPAGWSVKWKADPTESASAKFGGRVFEIASGRVDANGDAPTTYGSFYRNMLLADARKRWEGTPEKNAELAPIDGLSQWTLVESSWTFDIKGMGSSRPAPPVRAKSLTAYRTVGWDTLYIWFRAPDDGQYEQGKQGLIGMLKSYREEKVFIGP
jgi:hypothetical protein